MACEKAIAAIFFLLACLGPSVFAVKVRFEADVYARVLNGISNERVIARSSASNKYNVYLHPQDSVQIHFCLPSEQTVTVSDIRWSNDGWVDQIDVKIDGQYIGTFETHDKSDLGHLWNVIQHTGTIGSARNLRDGLHILELTVTNGDIYGIEFDSVILDFPLNASLGVFFCYEEYDWVKSGLQPGSFVRDDDKFVDNSRNGPESGPSGKDLSSKEGVGNSGGEGEATATATGAGQNEGVEEARRGEEAREGFEEADRRRN